MSVLSKDKLIYLTDQSIDGGVEADAGKRWATRSGAGVKCCAVIAVDFSKIKAIGTASLGEFLPKGAVIIRVVGDVDIAFASAGNLAQISIGVAGAATAIQTAAAVSGAPYGTTGTKDYTKADGTAANAIAKLTVDGQILFTTATEALTAGHMTLWVEYYVAA